MAFSQIIGPKCNWRIGLMCAEKEGACVGRRKYSGGLARRGKRTGRGSPAKEGHLIKRASVTP